MKSTSNFYCICCRFLLKVWLCRQFSYSRLATLQLLANLPASSAPVQNDWLLRRSQLWLSAAAARKHHSALQLPSGSGAVSFWGFKCKWLVPRSLQIERVSLAVLALALASHHVAEPTVGKWRRLSVTPERKVRAKHTPVSDSASETMQLITFTPSG